MLLVLPGCNPSRQLHALQSAQRIQMAHQKRSRLRSGDAMDLSLAPRTGRLLNRHAITRAKPQLLLNTHGPLNPAVLINFDQTPVAFSRILNIGRVQLAVMLRVALISRPFRVSPV